MDEMAYEYLESADPGETWESEWEGDFAGEVDELEEELATQLLEIASDEELDQFLGKLASSVIKGASKFVKSPVGKALGGALKSVAKKALPVVGGAIGSALLPGAGTAIGSKLGSLAGGLLEAEEAEMMSDEEAEMEAARRYVRFARTAYSHAARAPRGTPPRAVARAASVSAARSHAPGLLRDRGSSSWRSRRRRGSGYGRGGYPLIPVQPWYVPTWDGDDDDGYGPYDDDWSGEAAPKGPKGVSAATRSGGPGAQTGRWVRRGTRIVVLGL